MQKSKQDPVMIYQSYAKTDVYCNASLRNKKQKQKQKENSDVAGN